MRNKESRRRQKSRNLVQLRVKTSARVINGLLLLLTTLLTNAVWSHDNLNATIVFGSITGVLAIVFALSFAFSMGLNTDSVSQWKIRSKTIAFEDIYKLKLHPMGLKVYGAGTSIDLSSSYRFSERSAQYLIRKLAHLNMLDKITLDGDVSGIKQAAKLDGTLRFKTSMGKIVTDEALKKLMEGVMDGLGS